MVEIEVANRSGAALDLGAAADVIREVLQAEGIGDGELGLQLVGPDEIRDLKREHLGIDEETDALAFPIDGRDALPAGVPRQLGDVVLCPQVVGDAWRPSGARRVAPRRLRPRGGDGSPGAGSRMRVRPSVIESFNFAIEGVIHVLRTQRNMRLHFAAAVVVIVVAVAVGVSKIELSVLLISIAFVLVAEMINTAVEGTIDAATTSFDPMAKLAKDIAAGAVLIASVNAVAVGYLVFAGKAADKTAEVLDRVRSAPAQITLVALVLTVITVIATKAWTGRGTPLRGGLPSGHAAVAFAGWMAATYIVTDSHRFVVSALTFIMALLVAQTRVESGVHSALEVAYGGALGALVTLAVFQLL
jgi:diacylglycerol kinase (ATP)